jgi:hypothetical protein
MTIRIKYIATAMAFAGLLNGQTAIARAHSKKEEKVSSSRIVVIAHKVKGQIQCEIDSTKYTQRECGFVLGELRLTHEANGQIALLVSDDTELSTIVWLARKAVDAGFNNIRNYIYRRNGQMAAIQFGPVAKIDLKDFLVNRRAYAAEDDLYLAASGLVCDRRYFQLRQLCRCKDGPGSVSLRCNPYCQYTRCYLPEVKVGGDVLDGIRRFEFIAEGRDCLTLPVAHGHSSREHNGMCAEQHSL